MMNLNADQEWISKEDSKKTVSSVDSWSMKETKKLVNQESSEWPQNFKNLISDIGGSKITLVIEKTLYKSDLNPQQNGLLIPSQKVKNSDFLLPTKLESLGKKENKSENCVQITFSSLLKKRMEKHRAKLCCQWFQCRLHSSSTDKNKLKEPLVDSDDSIVPFSSSKKAANAFSYCLDLRVQVAE
ncbi:hypothetical protein Ahy_A04g017569 [Arachis hypogaea]|uniref:Uncharacterized protein n=1 Tax=Arachis hypogaea TaxID=3818 RepID=A0A445DBG4_ARAHY|nr:hypothetical protein Ahy_A04g017569 [Arachis hypogaea]